MKYYIFFAIALVVAACTEEKKAPLSKKDFTNLLIDIHMTDAVLEAADYRVSREENYREKYYNFIYEKYGINSADFDSCVVVYSENLAEYEMIYQVVVDSLNRYKSSFDKEYKEKKKRDTLNLWPGKKIYSFKKDSVNIIECDVPFNDKGMYSLSLRVKVRKADKGKNNRLTAYFIKKTSMGQDSIIPFDTVRLRKDTIWRYYSMHKMAVDTNYTKLHFKLLDCNNLKSLKKRDVEIKSIKLLNPIFEGPIPPSDRFDRFRR